MASTTLEAMANGGIYDQVGGGFHRYSTDERWLVPHFEKMLYDNAQLARRVPRGATRPPGARTIARVAREVLDYVLREMTVAGGRASTRRPTPTREGEEGKFFVWTPTEVRSRGGRGRAALFSRTTTSPSAGTGRGRASPTRPAARPGRERSASREPGEHAWLESGPRSRRTGRQRVPPGLDDKVLTSWNGLMIGAIAEGGRVLGETRYLDAAGRAAAFVLATDRSGDGGLLRTWRAGARISTPTSRTTPISPKA